MNTFFPAYMIIFLFFWIIVILFNMKEIQYARKLKSSTDKKLIIWLQPILLFGILIRTVYLAYPFGNFPDESIAGYDAWCLAHFGVDQHLASYPVYLQSWGTGQSAIYAYLAIPFIKLFGLSIETLRMPMALISSSALLIFYFALRKTQKDAHWIFTLILFLAINPWHIMKSRWALDCNLCPDLILIAISFILLALHIENKRKQTVFYLIAFSLLVLGAYSYGASWFMLPILYIFLIIFLIRRHAISTSKAFLLIGVSFLLATPLLLFAYQLVSGHTQYNIGAITITQLEAGRQEATTFIGADNPMEILLQYLRKGVKLIITGDDKLRWNSFPVWGQFFNPAGLAFICIAGCNMIKRKSADTVDTLFLLWLLASIPMAILVEPNVNHWNLLWFPLSYFAAKGIEYVISKKAIYRGIGYSILIIMGLIFTAKYFTAYNTYEWTGFVRGQEKPIKFTNTLNVDSIYYPDHFIHAHILFFDPISPYEYAATRKMDGVTKQTGTFSRNRFYNTKHLTIKPNSAYIIPNYMLDSIETKHLDVKKYDIYSVVW